MSAALTVADSKRAFHRAFPYVIGPLYRRMVDELLVELHLLSRQQGFQSDPLFAVGLVQVFDGFAKGYRPEAQREPLFAALCSASGFDGAQLRQQHSQALAAMGHHSVEAVKQWIEQQGAGAPEPIASALASIQRPNFHYSRLMAVGLMALLEQAQGADAMDPDALRSYAHDLGASIGLLRDRLDKDLKLYASNLEKMAQAVELMEETVAAEKRKRERRAAAPALASDPTSSSGGGPDATGPDDSPSGGDSAPGVPTAG
ncbi:MAG: photosystem II biogenesis protein Psp29 [Cyanobacteria bacterium M_surface_7_m2_040]|nr:photosystem II biogenesis protein Psp29 [Cyanobacteria bacterium K_Offshore_0m_m2_072]MBM5827968.1 photosystem II biogenesis protein Psp29 [Cyanobacteria bacterium M_surface_7_m2_040]